MKEYGLGPNGAIITCLNLMCTRFDQVLNLVRQRSSQYSMCIIDTPGQIEAFTWSASGAIITDSLASSHPTVYIMISFLKVYLGRCLCCGHRSSHKSHDFYVQYVVRLLNPISHKASIFGRI